MLFPFRSFPNRQQTCRQSEANTSALLNHDKRQCLATFVCNKTQRGLRPATPMLYSRATARPTAQLRRTFTRKNSQICGSALVEGVCSDDCMSTKLCPGMAEPLLPFCHSASTPKGSATSTGAWLVQVQRCRSLLCSHWDSVAP